MKNTIFSLWILCVAFTSCKKNIDLGSEFMTKKETAPAVDFVKYTIKKGEQYCDLSTVTKVEYQELKFKVRFDSSAIYSTIDPSNQADINKLFGFSDNNAFHHEYSARFGWNWSPEGLALYAYTYNNKVREHKLLGIIKIGEENNCSIKISGDKYVFGLNEIVATMPRTSTTTKAVGYKLFPYFGGNEMAPHNITIWIKEMQTPN